MIVTKPPSAQDKKRQTSSEALLRAGLEIYEAIMRVCFTYEPMIVAQEAAAGSKSARAAAALARAQQACGDAVFAYLGALPIFATQQAVKKAATGNQGAGKKEIEEAMKARWEADLAELLRAPPIYADLGQRAPASGKWENAFDALAVANCVWDEPAVAALRNMAA